jgi:branched-chain amino acid transport system ATP-binding protein
MAPPVSSVAGPAGLPLLEVRGLTSHYGRIQALKGVDLLVRPGQLVAIVGANGAGKTTLLRTLSGVQPASGGDVLYGGPQRRREFARGEGARRHVAGAGGSAGLRSALRGGQPAAGRLHAHAAGDRLRAAARLELFPVLHEKRALPAGTLSGGQQQMLAMARALMARPRLLLLDEPSMGLAPLLIVEIFRIIRALVDQGMTILLVSRTPTPRCPSRTPATCSRPGG